MPPKQNSKNRILQDLGSVDWGEKLFALGQNISDLCIEVYSGVKEKTMPVTQCCLFGSFLLLASICHLDRLVFKKFGLLKFYPASFYPHLIYSIFIGTSGFLILGFIQLGRRRKLLRRLSEALISSDLKNALGKLPSFIFDRPIDKFCRKLRLTRANLSFDKFKEAKSKLESSLQIFIEDLREDRAAGTVEIVYAHLPMPTLTKFEHVERIPKGSFNIGSTRSEKVTVSLKDIPHFLIAGQTGGGKSTFLRQLITALYLRNKKYRFTLIDLKSGLEFGLFENLGRVTIAKESATALSSLSSLDNELNERMALLQFNNCKDLSAFRKLDKSARKVPPGISLSTDLDRHVLIIDECAELFLTSPIQSARDAQKAKEIVSRLTRLGRASGIHVILGTQRPDGRAVDTQIKGNLPGKLCFQMTDHHSSMVILGNGRARDLPEVPGRAIWQAGLKMTEVQTPYLDTEGACKLLDGHRTKKAAAGSGIQLEVQSETVKPAEVKRRGDA